MSAILLVRHGQASFGGDAYDQLSPLGVTQSRALGAALCGQGVVPAVVTAGAMRRQRDTASAMLEGAGWRQEVSIDPAWDEFDVGSFLPGGLDNVTNQDSRAFQRVLDDAMRTWAGRDAGAGAGESFTSFAARVEAGLQRLVTEPGRPGPIVVSTSAGAISWAVTSLLGGGVEQWICLNRVCINAAVTKLIHGRSGLSLVSFNEHGHLSAQDVTYR
jgi:broad specificity phosphatase PhoE